MTKTIRITINCDFELFFKIRHYLCRQNHNIMLVSDIGNSIKVRRKELQITQPHLAELAEISTNTLCKLERGQGNPSLQVLCKIAEVLGMEILLKIKK